MSRFSSGALRLRLLPACLALIPAAALAQGVATDNQLQPVEVNDAREQLDPTLPSTTASKTREQLRKQNVFNPEDVAARLPGVTVRKRYAGDRNATVGGRSHGTLQPGRSLVYLDGYLISNFLGRFDAPRWNMVNVEAIERVDALYGPFSAIYPGNSMGTTIVITERKPKGFEASASLKYNRQHYRLYATNAHYGSKQLSARVASRLDSGLWYALALQRQDSRGHPQMQASATRGITGGAFAAPGTGTRVNGILYDVDQQRRPRAIFGATSIDHTVQDTLNLRLGYDISATQEVEGRLSFWRHDSHVHAETYLRDAAGRPVWRGRVHDGTYGFNLNDNTFMPSQGEDLHRQLGLTWKTRHATGWNGSVVFTHYEMLKDLSRRANQSQPLADAGGAGTVTRRNGTGWNTLEAQATYTPVPGDFGGGRHALVFGLHRNGYKLENIVNSASDWRHTETGLNQRYAGKTAITAIYGQDAWRMAPDWLLTTGLRLETFRASNGFQYFAGPPAAQQVFASRSLNAISPKLSLAWTATDDLLLRASFGRGTRFPSVDELFNGTKTGSSIITSDPNLRPEVSRAFELTAEKYWGQHWLRASLFRDDVKDTILRQTDFTVTPTVTRVSNIDRVVTNGLELAWQLRDLGIKGLDVGGSAIWADAVVKANTANPALVGKKWVRIPRQRYTLEAGYRPNEQWLLGAVWRWHGRMFISEMNLDTNPDVYGGASRVNQLDLKAVWRLAKHWEWSLGVNNVNNDKAWQHHPFPQRSIQTELRFAMQ